jgi:hypothetical protein
VSRTKACRIVGMAEGLVEAFRALDLHAEPRLTKVDSFDSAALVGTENDPRDRSFEIRWLKSAVTIPGSQPSTPSGFGSKIPSEACRPSKLEFQRPRGVLGKSIDPAILAGRLALLVL